MVGLQIVVNQYALILSRRGFDASYLIIFFSQEPSSRQPLETILLKCIQPAIIIIEDLFIRDRSQVALNKAGYAEASDRHISYGKTLLNKDLKKSSDRKFHFVINETSQ